ncbi:heterokaryon incompatibility protein-domain-containing protein [Xylariales sp. AK1849]|nr:heterokaryon incompatibility protein-domain-containing protein [Xylariales sp. AK1849]
MLGEMDEFDEDIDTSILERMPWLETPLDASRSCIRLMKLHKGIGADPIVCSLQVASLDDDPEYESLSYVWGDPTRTVPINVGGERFDATENLVEFLRCLRLQTADRLVWADAICIDQTNVKEKSKQLGLMGRVYQQASEAHIWFGHFMQSWQNEIDGGESYVPASRMTAQMWAQAERYSRLKLDKFLELGGKAVQRHELPDPMKQSREDLLTQTLDIFDQVVGEKHLYDLSLYIVADNGIDGQRCAMNRQWPVVLDCMRWLLTRPWWTRVWTLQEAVLPRVDPLVHIGAYATPLSRILDGGRSFVEHPLECCKDIGQLLLAEYQRFPFHLWLSAWNIHGHRSNFAKPETSFLSLEDAISSTQGRKATDVRDHFFGVLGLLPQEWQGYFQDQGYSCDSADIFGQCTKMLFTNNMDLKGLGNVIGLKKTAIPKLPSWAIDLSQNLPDTEEGEHRWDLYDACPGPSYEGVKFMHELQGPGLELKVIHIGSVSTCASRVLHDDFNTSREGSMALRHVSEWQQLHRNGAGALKSDSFWRTAFMDRNIWRYWLHKRRPLPRAKLDDIKRWWQRFKETGDERDLQEDRQNGGRGTYHYRALTLNLEKCRFFCTEKGEPGLGPHEVQPSDEIYALAGCRALAVLRRIDINEQGVRKGFSFAGLCFLDGWMYGEATLGKPQWQTIILY